jgi:hypothetical protein
LLLLENRSEEEKIMLLQVMDIFFSLAIFL